MDTSRFVTGAFVDEQLLCYSYLYA